MLLMMVQLRDPKIEENKKNWKELVLYVRVPYTVTVRTIVQYKKIGFYTNNRRNLRILNCVCRKHSILKFRPISKTCQPWSLKHKFNFNPVSKNIRALKIFAKNAIF